MLTSGRNILWGFCLFAFLVASHPANSQFIEVSNAVGINHLTNDLTNLSGGVAFLDFQNDGFEDIYLIGGGKRDKLYENQGDGTFIDVTFEMGLGQIYMIPTMGVAVGDMDNDGFVDLLVTTKHNERTYLFWNERGTSFKEGAIEAGIQGEYYGSSAAFGDYNLDGLLDLYIGNYDPSESPGDFFYQNNGDRTFSDVSQLLGDSGGGTALAVSFSDFDRDHDVDILVGNDFGIQYGANRLFSNNFPENSFSEVSKQTSWDIEINSMGIAVGDYDEDGDLDYHVSDIGDNFLFNNRPGNSFLEEAYDKGLDNAEGTSWGNAFFDYNNDAYLDLFVANGVFETGPSTQSDRLYQRNKDVFEEVSEQLGVASTARGRGVAIGDYNNDGHQDILVGVVGIRSDNHHTLLYQNPGNENSWIKVKLMGVSNNASAYGSRVEASMGERRLIRELSGGTSYLSSMSTVIHFGLADATGVDSLKVVWPDGTQQSFSDLEVNKSYLVVEDDRIYESVAALKTIAEGTRVFLQGAFREEAGIYRDTLFASAQIPKIATTRLALVETLTGLKEGEGSPRIWPNPFKEDINVSLTNIAAEMSECNLKIYNLLGHLVFEEKRVLAGRDGLKVNLSKLPVGAYLLQLQAGQQLYSSKIVHR